MGTHNTTVVVMLACDPDVEEQNDTLYYEYMIHERVLLISLLL